MNECSRVAKHKASPVIGNLRDNEVDQLLVDWARWLLFQAYYSSTLDRFMAASLFEHPDFGKERPPKNPEILQRIKGIPLQVAGSDPRIQDMVGVRRARNGFTLQSVPQHEHVGVRHVR